MRLIICISFFLFLLFSDTFPSYATAYQSTTNHTDTITTVAFSPDGKTLASGSLNRKIILWDIATGQPTKTLFGHTSYIYAVTYTPDGSFLISGGGDKTIRFWNSKTGEQTRTFEGHDASVTALAISPNGKVLASGDTFGTIKLWDIKEGKEMHSITSPIKVLEMILFLVFTPDGKTLADARGLPYIRLWNVQTSQEIGKLSADNCRFTSVTISSNGKMIAGGCSDFNITKGEESLRVWNLADGKEMFKLKLPTPYSSNIAAIFSKDNTKLFSLHTDKTIRIWDLASKSLDRTEITAEFPQALALSFDGKFLVSSGWSINKPSLFLLNGYSGESLKILSQEPNIISLGSSTPKGTMGGGYGSGIGGGGSAGSNKPSGEIDYNKTFRSSEVTKKAVLTYKAQPAYTEKARMNMIQGVIRISAVLRADGQVSNIRVISELPFGLTDMAVKATTEIQFTPAVVNERAVSQYVTLEYNFRIY